MAIATLPYKNFEKKDIEINQDQILKFILDSFEILAQDRKNIVVKKLYNNYYRVNIYKVDKLSDYFLPKKLIIKSMFIKIVETKDGLTIEDKTEGEIIDIESLNKYFDE